MGSHGDAFRKGGGCKREEKKNVITQTNKEVAKGGTFMNLNRDSWVGNPAGKSALLSAQRGDAHISGGGNGSKNEVGSDITLRNGEIEKKRMFF